jgi:hypothetical protein
VTGVQTCALPIFCKNFSFNYSRVDATESLFDYLKKQNLIVISDVDTRALVSYIRDNGAMNAVICTDGTPIEELKEKLKQVPDMNGLELASKVSTTAPYFFGDESAKYKISALDLGIKTNILRNLAKRDCYIKVFPYNASFEELKALAITRGNSVFRCCHGGKLYQFFDVSPDFVAEMQDDYWFGGIGSLALYVRTFHGIDSVSISETVARGPHEVFTALQAGRRDDPETVGGDPFSLVCRRGPVERLVLRAGICSVAIYGAHQGLQDAWSWFASDLENSRAEYALHALAEIGQSCRGFEVVFFGV